MGKRLCERRALRTVRLALEPLEDRQVPSVSANPIAHPDSNYLPSAQTATSLPAVSSEAVQYQLTSPAANYSTSPTGLDQSTASPLANYYASSSAARYAPDYSTHDPSAAQSYQNQYSDADGQPYYRHDDTPESTSARQQPVNLVVSGNRLSELSQAATPDPATSAHHVPAAPAAVDHDLVPVLPASRPREDHPRSVSPQRRDVTAEEFIFALARSPQLTTDSGPAADNPAATLDPLNSVTVELLPQAGDLIAGVIPFEAASLEERLNKILDQVKDLSRKMQVPEPPGISHWFFGVGTITIAFELAWRRVNAQRRRPELDALFRTGLTSTWRPSSRNALRE